MTTRQSRAPSKALVALFVALPWLASAQPVETEMFRAEVAAGKLPSVQKRLPATPMVVRMDEAGMQPGSGTRLTRRSVAPVAGKWVA